MILISGPPSSITSNNAGRNVQRTVDRSSHTGIPSSSSERPAPMHAADNSVVPLFDTITPTGRGRPCRISEIEYFDFIDSNVHTIVRTAESKYKPCVFCQIQKRKTKKGWYIYTYYKCKACDIPLCTGQRNCFNEYHAYISGQGQK